MALVCEECGARNYKRTKAKGVLRQAQPERLTLKKFCPHCKRHTVHRESK